jgi:hypothetical protein
VERGAQALANNCLHRITGFDRTRGATFNVAMPTVTWVGKQSAAPSPAAPGMHLSGQIVC